MLLVIMHNDKEYLDEVLSIIHTEGIFDASIFEKKGLVKSIHGIKSLFVGLKQPEIEDEFDFALISAVPGEEKVDQLNECIQEALKFHPSIEDGLMFILPYDNIEKLFKKSRGDEDMASLASLIIEKRICLELSATDKMGIIKEMIEVLGNYGRITDKEELLQGLLAREDLETTGIGDGIALPHARTDIVTELMVAFGRSKKGLDFGALDDKPVHLVFLIVGPKKDSSKLMRLLAGACRVLRNEDFRKALLTVESKQDIIKLIEGKDR